MLALRDPKILSNFRWDDYLDDIAFRLSLLNVMWDPDNNMRFYYRTTSPHSLNA